jgi:PPP family 3-phenylpropionic acid transporter
MLAFSFFWHAALPLLEVNVMNREASQAGIYGRVRLWGSIGFIASVTLLGALVDWRDAWWVLPALSVLMSGIWFASLTLPETGTAHHPAGQGRFRHVLRRPEVIAFLLSGVLMQASHGPYYTFYSIYLRATGYDAGVIGLLWAFGVLCEIVAFIFMARLFAALPVRKVLLGSFALAALRWLLIGRYPDQMPVLIFAQMLHAASFGTFHAASMQLVHRYFTGRHQHRGQAIYGGIAFGVGGTIGSFASGQLWAAAGPMFTFACAAAAAALAFVVTFMLVERNTVKVPGGSHAPDAARENDQWG